MKTFLVLISVLILVLAAFPASGALQPPNLEFPTSADSPLGKGRIELVWSSVSGANYYQYHIDLPDGTAREKIVFQTRILIWDLPLGHISWAVKACEDSVCQVSSIWSSPQSFDIIAMPEKMTKGLVPCGRIYDNPNTQVNEAEPCKPTHIFFLIRNVLDFLLWEVGPIILVLLAVATGVIFYFSMGGPMVMAQAKSLLRSAIVGYGLIFLAWIIINLILAILGYRVGVFGRWWEIRF